MYTRNASDDQRPKSMILWTGWFMRNSPIAAPDRMDFVPISSELYPNVFFPPNIVHVDRNWSRRVVLVIWWVSPFSIRNALMVEFGPAFGIVRKMRDTIDAIRLTGQRTLSFVL